MRETDCEVLQEGIEEQVARESYLQWLREQEKRAKSHGPVSCSESGRGSIRIRVIGFWRSHA